MTRSLALTALLIFLALSSGCKPKTDSGSTPPPSQTVVVPEKSKKDVTICVYHLAPDVLKQKVKADGKQRVSWKGQDVAYEIWFETAIWPFEEAADETREASGVSYSIIKVPAYPTATETSNAFTLKPLSSGEVKEYSYRVGNDPPSSLLPPPNSPAVVGEG